MSQPVADRFIAGQSVANADLRPAWQNTTQSPSETWDAPVYEQVYRTVRAVNWTRAAGWQIRVLLGDPPIDWATNHRALLCYVGAYLLQNPATLHRSPHSLTAIIEQRTSERVYTITDLVPFAGDPSRLGTKLSRYPRDTVIPTAGTWLGAVDSGLIILVTETVGRGKPLNPYCGVPLGPLQDAGIYLGQAEDLTASRPNPATYLDPVSWRELQRRNTLQGNPADLKDYRKERPAQYALPSPPPSAACARPDT